MATETLMRCVSWVEVRVVGEFRLRYDCAREPGHPGPCMTEDVSWTTPAL